MPHTPGDWKIAGYAGEHKEAGATIEAGNQVILTTSRCGNTSSSEAWAEYYANARLCAASPVLLMALKEALQECRDHNSEYYRYTSEDTLERWSAAISDAE